MPVKLKTPLSEFDMAIDELTERAENAILDRLCYIGSKCINEARENGNYNNPTGNLRSSIGYAVVKDGQVIEQAVVERTGNGTEGKAAAEAFMAKLVRDYPKGICLIVVAGMNYASYVEEYYGRNVLSSSELLADRLVPQELGRIGFIVRKK